ncbi:MAG: coenzyme F420-0:L-glutamate ligase [Promethearchaeota archaeon]
MIQVVGLKGIPIVKEGDKIGKLIVRASRDQDFELRSGDILVIAQKIVSRAEGNTINLGDVTPSQFAKSIATTMEKDPRKIEVILNASKSVVRMSRKHLITETHHGFVCANSGVDLSNVPGNTVASLLPADPDRSAEEIRVELRDLLGIDVAVIVSDTHGRPLRQGAIGVAIGVAGIRPILDYKERKDLFNYTLETTKIAMADELASAAELLMGEANEGIPVVIIRGYGYQKEKGSALELIRPVEEDLFR